VSLPADPLAAAGKVQTIGQAAKLNDELEAELALNDELDPEWEKNAEAARDQLADRFGGFDALHAKTQGRAPKPVVKDGQVIKPKKPAKPAKTSKPAAGKPAGKGSPAGRGRASAGTSKTGGRRRASSSGARRFAGGLVGDVAQQSGSTAAGSMGLWVLAGTIGLTLLYVLISGRGPQAVTWSASSLVRGLTWFMAPTDPLNSTPKGEHLKQTAAKAVADSPGAGSDTNGGGGDYAPSIPSRSTAPRIPDHITGMGAGHI
jgi:hypothetical protein